MDTKNEWVVRNLRELIKASGLSQNQTAAKAGMTTQRLSNILNLRGSIQPVEVVALSEALRVSIDKIFERKE